MLVMIIFLLHYVDMDMTKITVIIHARNLSTQVSNAAFAISCNIYDIFFLYILNHKLPYVSMKIFNDNKLIKRCFVTYNAVYMDFISKLCKYHIFHNKIGNNLPV